jgi:Fic/DOC family
MTAPAWHEDDPRNLSLIQSNAARLITELHTRAAERILLTREELCRWHALLYAGCEVPIAGYVGHFRGDPAIRELIDYEVGLGPRLKDGNLEKMGVWARMVSEEMAAVLAGLNAVFGDLDGRLPVGQPPGIADQILQLISFAALAHGELLRVHPFANGNGRIARLLVAFICLRYGVPMFLHVKPRPESDDYLRASRDSMGRPPDFVGNHTTTTAIFAHMLADVLEGGADVMTDAGRAGVGPQSDIPRQ